MHFCGSLALKHVDMPTIASVFVCTARVGTLKLGQCGHDVEKVQELRLWEKTEDLLEIIQYTDLPKC